MGDIQLTVERLSRWLEANHDGDARWSPGATDDAITAVEQQLGDRLPDGLRAMYRWSAGGAEDPAIMLNRQLMPLSRIVETRAEMARLVDIGQFGVAWWDPRWIQFLTSPNSSGLCWDPGWGEGGRRGEVLEFWSKDRDRDVMAPTFDEWLNAFVDSLEVGIWSYDDGLVRDDSNEFGRFLAGRFSTYPRRVRVRMDAELRPRANKPSPAPKKRVAPDMSRSERDYRATSKFEVADRLHHPTFGAGVVQAVNGDKITVRFGTDDRVLVHGRA